MVKKYPEQGDVISIENVPHKLLVVSNHTFNEAGGVVVCPILRDVDESALHISINCKQAKGTAICEQLKFIQLKSRSFRIVGSISFFQLTDISDAIQGIFELI
ncbi:MAG: type II toxin-antitoxin system PemK/MazF family toxin [Lachnospiraceae bacterium]|nr:type II toxin-antitoxin system PemK/MazF family toxin [Lachnospiraceae bacterium]